MVARRRLLDHRGRQRLEGRRLGDHVHRQPVPLCRYKTKFGADLVPYHVVESGEPWMGAVKKASEFVK